MLEPADDRFRYRRYLGDTPAKARASARDDVAQLLQRGWQPCAERWDDRLGTLLVAFRTDATPDDALPDGEAWTSVGSMYGDAGATHNRRRLLVLGAVGLLAIALLALASTQLGATGDASGAAALRTASAIADSEPVPRFEPLECRGEWTDWAECGDLIVLEDRSKPDGPRIRLHVAILPALNESPEPDPIVYLAGGPGDSPLINGIGYVEHVLAAERELIVLDQRGTGTSEPSLACTAGAVAWWEVDALGRCRARLVREGADLAAYNTTASAADVEDLRTVLGYQRWNLYGVSYGSRVALAVMREHPAGVRSAILDSVYPMGVDGLLELAPNAQRAFDELFEGCSADARCAAAHGDVESHFYHLVDRLNSLVKRVPLRGYGEVEVDGYTLVWLLFDRMYVTDYLATIPATIERFWQGDWEELDAWVEDAYLGHAGRARRAALNIGAYHSIECAETAPFTDPTKLAVAGLQPALVEAFEHELMLERCAIWDVPAAAETFHQPVESDIPTLLLAGTYDPVTPPAWATLAAQTLPNGHLVVVPGVGHGVVGISSCVDGIAERFLERPSQTPAAGCVKRLQPPSFDAP